MVKKKDILVQLSWSKITKSLPSARKNSPWLWTATTLQCVKCMKAQIKTTQELQCCTRS